MTTSVAAALVLATALTQAAPPVGKPILRGEAAPYDGLLLTPGETVEIGGAALRLRVCGAERDAVTARVRDCAAELGAEREWPVWLWGIAAFFVGGLVGAATTVIVMGGG